MAKPSEQEIYNYLRSKPGVTHEHAMGIVANIKAESLFDPGVKGDFMIADSTGKLKNKERLVVKKGNGYVYSSVHPTKAGQKVEQNLINDIKSTSGGLFQHQGNRYDEMVEFVGNDWNTNWKGQIDFALQEKDGKNYLNETFTSVADSTESFMINFERPADQSKEKIQGRIDGISNLDLESNYTPVLNSNNKPTVKGDGRFRYSNEKGGFITEKEYNELVDAGTIAKKDPFHYNFFSDDEKELLRNYNAIDNPKDSLKINEDIFTKARTNVFNKYAFDENGNEISSLKINGKRVSDDQGASMLTQDLYNEFATELGYDPQNLQAHEKMHVSRYMQNFKKEIELARDGKYGPANNLGINGYLTSLGIPARGIDPFLEDIVEDRNFSEIYDRTYTDDWTRISNILEEESAYITPGRLDDVAGKSPEEIQKLIDEIPEVDTRLYGPTTSEYKTKVKEREEKIARLSKVKTFAENNPGAFDTYNIKSKREGELLVVDQNDLQNIESRQQEINQVVNEGDIIGPQPFDESTLDTSNTTTTAGTTSANDDTPLPDIVVERGLLDNIGGVTTVISALVGMKALKEANKPKNISDTPELSEAFQAELYQQEQMAKQGFSPEQEAQFRKQINDSYALGVENSIRGTAGDRAKFLAMSGVLDSRKQAALLDFAAKDDAAMRANQEQFRKTLMFKENFDQQRAQQKRNEEMAELQNKYSTNQMLASQAMKYAMDNINNAKADRMQNTLTQVMINDAAAGQNIVEKYNSSGLLGNFGKTISGLLGNMNTNNTEDDGNQ